VRATRRSALRPLPTAKAPAAAFSPVCHKPMVSPAPSLRVAASPFLTQESRGSRRAIGEQIEESNPRSTGRRGGQCCHPAAARRLSGLRTQAGGWSPVLSVIGRLDIDGCDVPAVFVEAAVASPVDSFGGRQRCGCSRYALRSNLEGRLGCFDRVVTDSISPKLRWVLTGIRGLS
jgi:hypothetical protein